MALSASGFPSEAYHFAGYLSKTISERENQLITVRNIGKTCVFFESPHRVVKTLGSMREVFGDRHQVFVAFELTKKFETHYRGSLEQIMEQLMLKTEDSRLKGEITMVLAPGVSEEAEMQQIVKGSGFDYQRDAI